MDIADLDELLAAQAGVVSRAQVLTAGGDDALVERKLRRRHWARVHRGVYVNHTGPLSWSQRCWAALLRCAPAALTAEAALAASGLRTGHVLETIHIALDVDRRVTRVPGIKVHRVTRSPSSVMLARPGVRRPRDSSLRSTSGHDWEAQVPPHRAA